MNYKIYSDGKEVSDSQKIGLFRDEAVGVFETMRAYNGKIFLEAEHLARLRDSARTVGYTPLPDPEKMRGELGAALRACGEKNTSVRLTFLGGRTFVIVGAREIPGEFYQKGVAVKTASFPRGDARAFPYQAKASAYQHAVLASTEPNPLGVFDWLFLGRDHCLAETRTANFFIVKHGVLLTPPEHLILNGVTRRFVIKCAFERGLEVREAPLTRHDFFNADEAFLTNTSWEILPVRELDGRTVGAEIPGPVTLKLRRFYQRRVQELCPSK